MVWEKTRLFSSWFSTSYRKIHRYIYNITQISVSFHDKITFRRSNKRQSTMSAHEKNELKLASMLMIVVVVFLICNILPLIVNILEKFEVGSINEVTETSNLLVTINSSVNFFIYIIFGERFKKQLCQCLQEKSCFKRLKNFWSRFVIIITINK